MCPISSAFVVKITIFGVNAMLEAENAVLAQQCLLIVGTS